MFNAELARRVGRSTDTIKSWEEQGLLSPTRDGQDRRVFPEEDVQTGLKLAELGIAARRLSQKLTELVASQPVQLSFIQPQQSQARNSRRAESRKAISGSRHES